MSNVTSERGAGDVTRDDALATLERLAIQRRDLFADGAQWGLLADLFEEEAQLWHALLLAGVDALLIWAASSAEVVAAGNARFWREQARRAEVGAP